MPIDITLPEVDLKPERDVFLSHSSADKAVVQKVARDITSSHGKDGGTLSVWLDEGEIKPGTSIPGGVNAGLEASRFFALLLSPAYFESRSGWTDAEWHSILHADPDNRRGRILPVLIADCPYLPILLRHLLIIDMREPNYSQGLRELLGILSDKPEPPPTIYRGQLIVAGNRLSRTALVAERALVDAEPRPGREQLSCNLFAVERLPTYVHSAKIATRLRSTRADDSLGVPSKEILKDIIRAELEAAGRRPFTPAFRVDGEHIVTFHDLGAPDTVFGPIIEPGEATYDRTTESLLDPDDRRVVTSLLNMAISRHAYKRGLDADRERIYRFYFAARDGATRSVTWKPFRMTRSREVAGKRSSPKGDFWRHAAAYLQMLFTAGRYYLKVDSTWVFTTDGTTIMRGPDVGRLAIQWSGAERNIHLLYHVRFWSHVLRDRPGPLSVTAGDQSLEISAQPAFINLDFGIPTDRLDLDQSLDTHAESIEEVDEAAIEAELERRLSGDPEPEVSLAVSHDEDGDAETDRE